MEAKVVLTSATWSDSVPSPQASLFGAWQINREWCRGLSGSENPPSLFELRRTSRALLIMTAFDGPCALSSP